MYHEYAYSLRIRLRFDLDVPTASAIAVLVKFRLNRQKGGYNLLYLVLFLPLVQIKGHE